MIIKKFPGKFNNENIVIPRHYSEVSYLNELLKILNNQLNDDFELYVIYRDFNVDINTNSNQNTQHQFYLSFLLQNLIPFFRS